PGLASLVVQCQVFITVGLAALIEKEPVRGFQLVGLALAAAGLAVVALAGGGAATPLGLTLVLLAALSWAVSNLVVRSASGVNMLAFVAWSSLFAIPPLLGSAWMFEGGEGILNDLRGATPATWAAVAWQSVGNTLFGYGVWAWLLTRYPAATVAPTALLVPVFGISASALLLGERLEAWKLLAAGLIILGLVVNLFWERLARLARGRDL
ncbi:MAG: EamA family transporter, partial [Caulobacteraceae bacterium]